jgi:hypothetical protein
MKTISTLQAASLVTSILLIAPLCTQAEPMTLTAPVPRSGIADRVAQRTALKEQAAPLATVLQMHPLAGMGTFAEVRASLPPGRNRASRSTNPGSPKVSFDGLPQIVRALPAQVVPALPNEFVPPLNGQIIPPLPGEIVGPLPGQLVGPLPGQITPVLPGQILR